MKRIPLEVGKRVNRLIIIGEAALRKGRRHVLVRCDCGNETSMDMQNLLLGKAVSCGCFRAEVNSALHKTHGHAGGTDGVGRTSEYRIWSLMIQRCENPKNPAFDRYGGRGITVCKRWHQFVNFLEDMGRRPSDRSLDRKNNDGNYERRNCRWATRSEQMKNRRPFKRKQSCMH